MSAKKVKEARKLSDTKSRAIIVVIIVIVIVGAAIGYFGYQRRKQATTVPTGASVQGAPSGIKSIPGVGQSTTQYAKLVQQSNVEGAQKAAKTGTSSVPTLVRAAYQGPSDFNFGSGNKNAQCNVDALRRARASGVKASELRCAGCTAQQLLAAGYTPGELAAAGFDASTLGKSGVSAAALRAAGYTAAELRRAGYTCDQLVKAGYDAKEIAQAGYNQTQLKQCLTTEQLKAIAAGAKVSGLPANFPKDCSAASLTKAHQQNISAKQIRSVLGCTAAEFKAGGYTAKQLKDAGFTAGDLKRAGFSAKQLKDAGFTPEELRKAGFTAGQLKDAGFTAGELAKAGFSKGDLARAGFATSDFPTDCSAQSLQAARKNGISVLKIREALNCTAAQFKAGGYSARALKDAGFTAKDLKAAGYTPAELKAAGYTAKQLKDAGFTPEQLKAAGYSAKDLLEAGYTPDQLKKAGYSEGEIAKAEKEIKEEGGATGVHGSDGLAGISGEQGAQGSAEQMYDTPESQAKLLSDLRKQQEKALSEQQRQNLAQQLEGSMLTQANDLVSSWAPPTTQEYKQALQQTATAGEGEGAGTGSGSAAQTAGPVIKAGTIMFAVLDTGINSDEASPIMATIVHGKLKGAKLLGQFKRVNKKVILSFSLISVPDQTRSLSLNAVAIDPNTARTAMASRVNSHYLLRYGTLFASAFVSGLGSAIQSSGSTTTGLPGGTFVTTYQNLNKTELTLAALGNVGTQFSNSLGNIVNTPPTVYVKSGMGIGILFMGDFSIPVTNSATQTKTASSMTNGGNTMPVQQYQAAG